MRNLRLHFADPVRVLENLATRRSMARQQDARIFINIDLPNLAEDDAREQLRTLVARQQELNATAEIPSSRAWKRAKRGVDGGGQSYKADT